MDEKKQPTPFSSNLRKLMKEKKISQQVLADAVGVTRQTISQYMDGGAQPTIEKFGLIVDYFEVSADYFLGKSIVRDPSIEKKAISKMTGLTGKSIDILSKRVTTNTHKATTQLVNLFIQQSNSPAIASMAELLSLKNPSISKFYFLFQENENGEMDLVLNHSEKLRWACHRIASEFEEHLLQKFVLEETDGKKES